MCIELSGGVGWWRDSGRERGYRDSEKERRKEREGGRGRERGVQREGVRGEEGS